MSHPSPGASQTGHGSGGNKGGRLRIAVLLHKIGHYDVAQLEALAREPGIEVLAIELNPLGSKAIYTRVTEYGFRQTTVSRGKWFFDFARNLFRALDSFNPSHIVAPGWDDSGPLLAYYWGAKRSIPVIVRSPSTAWDHPRSVLKERLKSLLLNNTNAAIVGGTPQRRYLTDLGMSSHALFDSCDVVDNSLFFRAAQRARKNAASFRKKLGLPKQYFLYCGRLAPEKNLERLVEAYASYAKGDTRRAWALVCVGDGELKQALSSRVSALGINGRVIFTGKKEHSELPHYYGLASAFVLPSLREPWGLVVNEAEACGLPVLVSKACGSAEDLVREGINGFTFDPTDTEELKASFAAMAGSKNLRSMGLKSRSIISKWPPRRYAQGVKKAALVPYLSRPNLTTRYVAAVTAFFRHKN